MNKTIEEKVKEALKNGFIFESEIEYLLNSEEYSLADFIGPGTFPCFFKKEDAESFGEILYGLNCWGEPNVYITEHESIIVGHYYSVD